MKINQAYLWPPSSLMFSVTRPVRNSCLLFILAMSLSSLFACTPSDSSAPKEEQANQAISEALPDEQKNFEEPASSGTPEPNVVRWGTASEKDNFGFEVYRGRSETGPFERVNPDVIPAAGTTDLPQKYEFSDTNIEAGTVYWYYIESISMSGERKRISPIYSSEPKPASNP